MRRGAVFSSDRKQRMLLTRNWNSEFTGRPQAWTTELGVHDSEPKIVGFVMLNPSDAGEVKNDMTVRKCIGFGKRWGFTGMLITNLVPIVSTDPYNLPPWSGYFTENEEYLTCAAEASHTVVVAWGGSPAGIRRTVQIAEHIYRFRQLIGDRELFCIGLTSKGDPLHPSRSAYTDQPEKWSWE